MAAVLVTVSIVFTAPVIFTEDGMLHATGLVGLGGVATTVQVRATVPVSSLLWGRIRTVEVFPVEVPAAMVIGVVSIQKMRSFPIGVTVTRLLPP